MRLFSSTHLLSQAHNLEALEVGKSLALDGTLTVLGPGAVVPGAVNTNLLPESLEGSVTGGAGKLLNDDGGQREIREGGGVAGDGSLGVGGRTLDKDLFSYTVSLALLLVVFAYCARVAMCGSCVEIVRKCVLCANVYISMSGVVQGIGRRSSRTRLWSMISTTAASFWAWMPVLKRTTRPTSTSLHWLALMFASPILTVCSGELGQMKGSSG
jgi:hypothetical protein